MERESFKSNLIAAFQDVSVNGVTEINADIIQSMLMNVLDSNDISLFTDPVLTNLIFLLDLNASSILIQHLIHEFKLKSLRLLYTMAQQFEEEPQDLPMFTDLPNLPAPGTLGQARRVERFSDKEIVTTYEIDHTGQALRLVSVEEIATSKSDLDTLNNNVIDLTLQ